MSLKAWLDTAAGREPGAAPSWAASSSGASSGRRGGGSRPRQSRITELKGVVDLAAAPSAPAAASSSSAADAPASAAASVLADTPTTLYLGEDAVLWLREALEAAKAAGDDDALLGVLRRLSAMPITRPLLESTRIGVTVGHLRKREGPVAALAGRIVAVWKAQLKEHKAAVRQWGNPPARRR